MGATYEAFRDLIVHHLMHMVGTDCIPNCKYCHKVVRTCVTVNQLNVSKGAAKTAAATTSSPGAARKAK